MKTFGIISEGPTDQIILENILVGFFGNDDLSTGIYPLQPLRDATDAEQTKKHGTWYKVFEYCQSPNFINAFDFIDYIIIQIDTDRCEEKNYDVKRTKDDGTKLTTEELMAAVTAKFNNIIEKAFGSEKFSLIRNRIIYAISVEEIECWLLPLYFIDKTKSATNSCIKKLNEGLRRAFTGKQNSFYIDPQNKSGMGSYYEKMSHQYSKHKTLMNKYAANPSLQAFIQKLIAKNIDLLSA